jgi:hypothetical protein
MIVVVVQMIVGLAIGWRALVAVNKMTGTTHHGIRLLYIGLATSAAAMVLTPLYSMAASDVPKLSALAAYLALQLVERRKTEP